MRLWILQLLIALDRAINALIGGSADETLSSRAFRGWRDRRYPGRLLKPVIDGLFFWQDGHCEQAHKYEAQRLRADLTTDTAGALLARTVRKGD